MPQRRFILALISAACLAPFAWAQQEDPQVEPAESVEPAPVEGDVADQPTQREVTIGPAAPDPLDVRQVPNAAESEGQGPPIEEQDVLGVPESELKIDPRTLGIAPGDPLPPLMREGEFIRNREARLIPTDERGHAVVILDPPADSGPEAKPMGMIVAPNRMLESMESLQQSRGDKLRFTLSGQVHTYRGVNYLLVTSQPRPWLIDDGPEAELAEQSEQDSADQERQVPDPDPIASVEEDNEETSEDVLKQLLGQRTEAPESREDEPSNLAGESQSPQIDPRPLVQGVAPDQPEPKLYEEGSFIINRTARIVRSGDGSHPVLIFEADDSDSVEPPMVIQNCKLLEEMEKAVATRGDHIPFVITGQVQTYRGSNYLLPSTARLEFDLQNIE